MAVLDLLTLILIDPNLAIEDLTSGVGRIFNNQLQLMLRLRGLLHFYWGRCCNDRGLVGLIFVWEAEAVKSPFQYSGIDFWILNKYLQTPTSLFLMRDVDPTQLLDLKGKCLFIRTQVRSIETEEFDDEWGRCKQATLADPDFELLQGNLFHVDAADKIQRDIGSLHRDNNDLHFVELVNTLGGIVSGEVRSQEITTQKSTIVDRVIELKRVTPDLPIDSQELITATRLSHVFVRDMRLFTAPEPHTVFEKDRIGPRKSWRSPENSYWMGDRRCFNYTGSLVNAEPRTPKGRSLRSHGTSYFETLSFSFAHDFQGPNDTETLMSNAFNAYRKCLQLEPQCKSVHLIIRPSKLRVSRLFIAWSTSSDSTLFHSSQLAKDSLSAVQPYLATTSPPVPSPGVPFHPRFSCANAEVIDFVLAPSASSAEKRAFLLYLEDMFEIMRGDTETCLGETDPLSVHHEGWVDSSEPAHSVEENDDISDMPAKGPTYRILACWDGEAEEAEWIREFVQTPQICGVPAQMIALCVERVVAKRVGFVRDELYLLSDGTEESDEDMGF